MPQKQGMDSVAAYEKSLELVAARIGDPVALIYARLFERHPELEELFVMDTDGGARGNMVVQALECGADILGADVFGTTFVASERSNHEGYGLDEGVFESLYAIMHTLFREKCGEAWTADMQAAWAALHQKVVEAGF